MTMVLMGVLVYFAFAIGSAASQSQDYMQECTRTIAPLNDGTFFKKGRVIHYSCNRGYRLEGTATQTCINGTWSPPAAPVCKHYEEEPCAADQQVMHGRIRLHPENNGYHHVPKGTSASVICDPGYSTNDPLQVRFVIVCDAYGIWFTQDGSNDLNRCTRKRCPSPPEVPRAIFHYMGEGMQVEYICSTGYTLLDPDDATLTCHNGQWEGPVPTCVLKTSCDAPAFIRNGKWSLFSDSKERGNSYEVDNADVGFSKYDVGTELLYTCSPGYKLEGPRILMCTTAQIWSSAPPICIPESEHIWYCPHFGAIKNGFCKCMGQDTADLRLCMPFHRGTRIECTCLLGYALQGVSVLTCTHNSGLNIGGWDWDVPTCVKRYSTSNGENDIGMLPDGHEEDRDKGYNSGDIHDSKTKVGSLVIVITTACSVLGILLVIMVVVIFRRKKTRTAIFQQGATPPPYARVHNTVMDEHDRLALMAYADASRMHLPSYEEAMQPGGRGGHIGGGRGPSIIDRSVSPTTSEYQRLPNMLVRSNMHHPNMGGDGNNNINNNNNNNANGSNRHSTITTSTMNRDGLSEIFGSVDTVNVSMSDASTAVTVETFDSGTSNRSMVSQRATAGSLNSSEDHLANDDAPLLETSLQREVDVVSLSSNPSRNSKDD